MKRTDGTVIKWRVEVRLALKWKAKGTFETRDVARARAQELRYPHWIIDKATGQMRQIPGYGFGNTRVQRVEKKS